MVRRSAAAGSTRRASEVDRNSLRPLFIGHSKCSQSDTQQTPACAAARSARVLQRRRRRGLSPRRRFLSFSAASTCCLCCCRADRVDRPKGLLWLRPRRDRTSAAMRLSTGRSSVEKCPPPHCTRGCLSLSSVLPPRRCVMTPLTFSPPCSSVQRARHCPVQNPPFHRLAGKMWMPLTPWEWPLSLSWRLVPVLVLVLVLVMSWARSLLLPPPAIEKVGGEYGVRLARRLWMQGKHRGRILVLNRARKHFRTNR